MRFIPHAGPSGSVARDTLLCFSHLRWRFVYQRPQHLLARAAQTCAVYFFEEPVFEESSAPRLDITETREGVTIVTPYLPHGLNGPQIVQAQRRLVDRLIADFDLDPRILWYYTPMALPFSRHLRADLIVYDNMDELSAFRGAPPRMVAMEREMLRRADVVFTGGQSLYEVKKGRHGNIHAFPSSIDATHFGQARLKRPRPLPDQDRLSHPRIGFFGVIDERMDVDLVGDIADLRPDWQLIMIGPVVKIDEATLPMRANIHWLGGKDYRELPDYLAGWDAGFMPFAINESTRFISPTKTPEFLAAGLPVVSTPIRDVISPYGDKGLVEIAADASGFVRALEAVLARPEAEWLRSVDAHLGGMSWDMTWNGMQAHMQRSLRAAEASRRDTAATTARL